MSIRTEDQNLNITPTRAAQATADKIHEEILSSAAQMGEYTLTALPTFDGGLSLFYAGRTPENAGRLRSFSVNREGILTGHACASISDDGTVGDFQPIVGGMIHVLLKRRGVPYPAVENNDPINYGDSEESAMITAAQAIPGLRIDGYRFSSTSTVIVQEVHADPDGKMVRIVAAEPTSGRIIERTLHADRPLAAWGTL